MPYRTPLISFVGWGRKKQRKTFLVILLTAFFNVCPIRHYPVALIRWNLFSSAKAWQ